MRHDHTLLQIAKVLLSEDDDQKTPEMILRRTIEAVGAERGFIVVREDGSYEQRFAVAFDRATQPERDRKWSRGLVRQAIESRRILYTDKPGDDPRFPLLESLRSSGVAAALVAPLIHGDTVVGAVYVEWTRAPEHGGEEVTRFITDLAELAGPVLARAVERATLRQRARSLERDLFAQHDFEGIVAKHPSMLALLKMVAQVAVSDATVLVRGETGTGKELIARALHVNSPRRSKPCVTLHTSALPGTILESELFGHKKGAFTGADRDRTGRVASAHGGTLFLDEVAEIAPDVQAKLLRFLQFGEIQPVGSDRVEKVDVRVIAATHQDLPALVEAGKFRRDLYYRLKVIELMIPPLRERRSDIPLLIDAFLRAAWRRPGPKPRFTPRAEQALLAHAYPGNVRELYHAVERACVLAAGPELDMDVLPPDIPPAAMDQTPLPPRFSKLDAEALESAREASVAEVERAFLSALMDKHGGNVSLAARESGIHRTYLQKLLARHRG